jgi:hypothetical protein
VGVAISEAIGASQGEGRFTERRFGRVRGGLFTDSAATPTPMRSALKALLEGLLLKHEAKRWAA